MQSNKGNGVCEQLETQTVRRIWPGQTKKKFPECTQLWCTQAESQNKKIGDFDAVSLPTCLIKLLFFQVSLVNLELDSLEREKAEGARQLEEKRREHITTLQKLGEALFFSFLF